MKYDIIEKFKNREVKAKNIFNIKIIPKTDAYDFIRLYHYLGDAKFMSMYSFGLFYTPTNELVGCATYSAPQGTTTLQGWFGLDNDDLTVVELSRLCLLPQLNGTNATSFLLGNSMKMLKPFGIRAVITLADSGRHIGSIYQVCNFKYYGLTDIKSDFYNSVGQKNVRGTTNDKHGVWVARTRKHRYAYILDKRLKCLYDEQPHPTEKTTIKLDCCGSTGIVFDKRFNEYYTCPICTGKLISLSQEQAENIKNSTNPIEMAKQLVINNTVDFSVESLW